MKHFSCVLFLFVFTLYGQSNQPARLAPDQAGCTDSKFFPKLPECRIDHCEAKDTDHREIAVGDNDNGDAINAPLDGSSRALMYECREGTTPASIVQKAAAALKGAGFDVPYRFIDAEGSLTARKDNFWITIDAASRFYTLTEITAVPPDFDSATDADSMAQMIELYGHVPLNGVKFLPGRTGLSPESNPVLDEVLTLMKAHPAWHVRIEAHTNTEGSSMANVNMSLVHAQAVVTWLTASGIKRSRLDLQGWGDAKPVADTTTEAGRMKNRRIELVKIAAPPGQLH